ncbi:hypothetical protein HNY73_017850 [Argiope bruennichi]|uniref:SWIM-type domain-containing protein n=1 Tax=Argiope bruennichi TaxID=94029 RepID=A0A8T0EF26_ARGBR|nr:hypothetical protein HNY73_017850 [Argiope bruennichi]
MALEQSSSISNSQTVPKSICLSSNSKEVLGIDSKYLQEKLLKTHYEVNHQIKENQANASLVNESEDPPVPQLDKECEDSPVPQPDKGRMRCIDCSFKFTSLKSLRRHLRKEHQLNVTEKKISFPNFNAFRKWKLDIECRESTYFYNYHAPFKGSNYLQKIYICHRSGPQVVNVREGRHRMNNLLRTCKTGISCTAAMKVNIYQNEVQVEYCLQHYGHGSEITLSELTAEEQAAVLGSTVLICAFQNFQFKENASNGIPVQEQLADIKHAKSLADHFKAWIIKKRDNRFFNFAYASEIYSAGMSAFEYVEHWVRLCSEMEECPVLLYKQEALGTKSEDFTLIIMSEFQKNLLMVSAKQVVCLDTFSQYHKERCFFTVLLIMDEQDIAFPVAFCLSKKMDKSIILQFFSSIKSYTGPLSCSYFMSNDDKIYYETWQEVMQDKPTWVWSIWSFEDDVRKCMKSLLKDIPTREATYRLLRTIMECTSQPVFTTMLENFKKSVLDNELSKHFGKSFESYFGSNAEMWAYCYRKDLKLSTNIYLEFLHKTLKYCFKMCSKQRLDKFVISLMKWLRFKMLDCLFNILDEEKIELAKATISTYHNMSLDIDRESIVSVADQTWLVQSENETDAYVTREFDSCPELCDLRCIDCDVCVHMYACTCVQSLIQANMCKHIHAVICKFVTPQFSMPILPVQGTFNDTCDTPAAAEFIQDEMPILPVQGTFNDTRDISAAAEFIQDESTDFREKVLKRMEDMYKQFLINKCKLNNNSLSEVMGMLNKCYQICANNESPSNLSSKSTQTETIPLLSSSLEFSDLYNNLSNSVSENNENFTFIPLIPDNFNTGNSSSSTNHENCNSTPVSSSILNTVSNSASEKNENITSMSVRSNDVSESDGKISLPSILPSDSSTAEHASKRLCVEKTNVPSFSFSTNSSSIHSITNSSTVTKTTISLANHLSHGSADTQLILASETSSVAESSLVLLHTESSHSCSDADAARNSSSNLVILDPLLSERPYLIKCKAPIIRIDKPRVKTSSLTENYSIKQSPLSSTLITNNPPEVHKFFWDSVSKRYFSMKDDTSLTCELNNSSDIILNSTSESATVSSSNEHSELDSTIVKSSVPHDSSAVDATMASALIPNQPHSPVSHNPIIVEAYSAASPSPPVSP